MRLGVRNHASTVLVATREGPLVAARPRVRDRLAARWRARPLDRALAEGVPPEASTTLAIRAERLTAPERRRWIAAALRRLVRTVHEDPGPHHRRVSVNRPEVAAARHELSLLADALDDPGPVTARGVAQAWLLLTDGTGPLYNPRSRIGVRASAAGAAELVRPWPPR